MAQSIKHIIWLDEVHPLLEEGLRAHGFRCHKHLNSSINDLKNLNFSVHGFVVRSRFKLDSEFLKDFPELEFIARSGAGMENIDEVYCKHHNISCFNAPEGNKNAVAEHALGLLLMLFNRLHIADKEVRDGIWDREGNRGLEIEGKTFGLIGYGNNGSQFAQILSGFKCKILAYDKYKSGFGTQQVKESSLEEIYAQADILSFHIPQTLETLFWLDTERIEKFEKPFYVINLSRGKIIETKALLGALETDKVRGACLDVLEFEKSSFEQMFEVEQLPVDLKSLINNKKVVLSPHVGGWTKESYIKLSEVLRDKILAHYRLS